MEYIVLSFLLLLLAGDTSSRPPAYVWVDKPRAGIEILVGDNMTLGYSFRTPQGAAGKYQVELSHYIPNNNYEDIWISANIDTESERVEMDYERAPGKVHVIPQGRGFTFIVVGFQLQERGRYLTDAEFNTTFSTTYTLQDTTEVAVYSRPSFSSVPTPTDVILKENNTAMFEWSITESPSLPEIDVITIAHTAEGSNYILVNQSKMTNTGQWVVVDPDDQRVVDRISYASSSKLNHISLQVRDLQFRDSGEYTIEIVYANHVATLQDTTNLHVTPGYDWKNAPSIRTMFILDEENIVEFEADIPVGDISQQKYELWRLGVSQEHTLLGYVMVHGKSVTNHRTKDCKTSWVMDYDMARKVLVITISKADPGDSGHYLMALRSGAETIIMEHTFQIVAQNVTSLNPTSDVTPKDQHGISCLSLYVDDILPSPDILLLRQSRHGDDPVVSTAERTSSFTICLSESALNEATFTAVLFYDSRAVAYRTEILIPINKLFGDDRTLTDTEHTDSPRVRSNTTGALDKEQHAGRTTEALGTEQHAGHTTGALDTEQHAGRTTEALGTEQHAGHTTGALDTEQHAGHTNVCDNRWHQLVILCFCILTAFLVSLCVVIVVFAMRKMLTTKHKRENSDEAEPLKNHGIKKIPDFLEGNTSNKGDV